MLKFIDTTTPIRYKCPLDDEIFQIDQKMKVLQEAIAGGAQDPEQELALTTLQEERKKAGTTFLIVPLNSQEVQVINDATMAVKVTGLMKNSLDIKTTLRNRLFVQCGLRGWENAGKDFRMEQRSILGLPKKDIITEDLLNSIPIDFVNDIGEAIAAMSVSSGIPEKN